MEDNEHPRHMTAYEKRLARMWIQECGESVEEVARRFLSGSFSWTNLTNALELGVAYTSHTDRLVALKDNGRAGQHPLARDSRDHPTKVQTEDRQC